MLKARKFCSAYNRSMAARYDDTTFVPIRNWTRGCRLTKAGMGDVFVGKNAENGQIFMIKSAPSRPPWSRQLAALQNEEMILRKLTRKNCPHIFRTLGWTTSDSVAEYGGKPTMDVFLEFSMPRGNLAEALQRSGPLLEPAARAHAFQLLQTLACMHRNGIVHRGIKPDNIMLFESSVKLTGFGLAKDTSRPNMCAWLLEPQCCTSRASVPQQFHVPQFSEDICALGCTVCEMVTGYRPMVDAEDSSTVSQRIVRALEEDATLATMPKCLDFIKRCVQKEDGDAALPPALPWTAQTLLDHPWIASLQLRVFARLATFPATADNMQDEAVPVMRRTPRTPTAVASPRAFPLVACKDLLCCRSADTNSVVAPVESPRKLERKLTRFLSQGNQ